MNDLFKLRKTWISSAHQGFVEGVLLLPYYSVVFAADLSSLAGGFFCLADFVVDAVFAKIFNRDTGFSSGHNTS